MHRFTIKKIILLVGLCIFISAFVFWERSQKPASNFRVGVSLTDAYRDCISATKPQQEKGFCLKDLADYAGGNLTAPEIDAVMASLTRPEELLWCHEFMHYAGWGLYKKTKNMSDAFLEANSRCDSGMFHGIVEKYISETSEGKDSEQFVASVAPGACEGDMAKNNLLPGVKSICYHGLGHAFMFLTDNDLAVSLSYCDFLSTNYIQSCYTGSLMENVQSKQVGRLGSHPSKFSYNPDDPNYPCSTVDKRHQDYCYIYKGVASVIATKGDFKRSFEECLRVVPTYQEKCFWGIGANIPGPHRTTKDSAFRCRVALEVDSRAYRECLRGAMSFLVQLNLGNAVEAAEFCNNVEAAYQNMCYSSAGMAFRNWITSEEELRVKCSAFPRRDARTKCVSVEILQ